MKLPAKPRFLLLVAIAAIIVAAAVWFLLHRSTAPEGLLEASGRIEGRITVITPKTQGLVSEIKTDEG